MAETHTEFTRDSLLPPEYRYVKILGSNFGSLEYREDSVVEIPPNEEFGEEYEDANGNTYYSGIYFCREEDAEKFRVFGDLIADVEIPDDADLSYEAGFGVPEWSASRVILHNIRKM